VKFDCIAFTSRTLSNPLIARLAVTLPAAAAVAQTSGDALFRGSFENDADQSRIDASIAEGRRVGVSGRSEPIWLVAAIHVWYG
jgi:hypothetical protein